MSDCCGKKEPAPEKKSCCGGEPKETPASSCCGPKGEESCCGSGKGRIDWLLWGSMTLVVAGIVGHFVGVGPSWWLTFSHGS